MKADIAYVHSREQGYTERLNSAVEIFVILGVFVMPHTGTWVSHFVTHEPDPVISWIGLDLAQRRASPRHDGRLHPNRRTNTRKIKTGWASANIKPAI